MYNEIVLEYFKNLKHTGRVRGANAVGKVVHEKSGDEVHIFMLIDEAGNVSEASFKAFGSVMTIAASSLVCSFLNQIHIKDITEITYESFENVFGKISENSQYSIELVLEAVYNAVKYYYDKLESNKE
jgi:NifU-like protein involved in Fe-S cluster formation